MTQASETTDGPAVVDNERLVFFSDAVVAIALTLLALELPVPRGASDAEVWRAFREHLPDYAMFLLSFAVIAAYWVAHKWLFGRIGGFSPRLLWLNFVWLLGIILVPFATKVLIEDSPYRLSAVLYAGVVGGTGLALINSLRHCRARSLLRPHAVPETMRRFQLFLTFPTVAFLLSIPLAFVSLSGAKYSWAAVFALSALATRWATHPGAHPDRDQPSSSARP
ncbi:TMEM175 family protein [Streptomyces sp. Qhu-G9]|uniref:TMEM175 family protein n=1 Tax=Streptomyces sp. Qhu-G9 TaxID=3452799 RepID=UPI0022ABCB2A|nr:TMEM175 family protein [Streptomyces aurantiacus]WAU82537.1 TMEM175 family protein [Streptomyces aurantiacus]